MTTDAETIANLRQSLAERDSEIRWLRDELRHADDLLLARTKIRDKVRELRDDAPTIDGERLLLDRRRVEDVSALWQDCSQFAPEGGGEVVVTFVDLSKPKADT